MEETPTPDTPTSDAPTSETPEAAPKNRMTLILLGVIAVLLVAVVVILATGGDKSTDGPTASNTGNTNTSTSTTGTTGGTPTEETPFDPATATQVASGQTPQQHVEAYFDAVVAGDYATAYEMLPTSKKDSYGGIDAFSSQLTGYGITGYTIDSTTEEGDETQVLATATMAGGEFQYLWTFVKVDDVWLVKSRTLPGMAQ